MGKAIPLGGIPQKIMVEAEKLGPDDDYEYEGCGIKMKFKDALAHQTGCEKYKEYVAEFKAYTESISHKLEK